MKVWTMTTCTIRTAKEFLPIVCQYRGTHTSMTHHLSSASTPSSDTVKPFSEMPLVKKTIFDMVMLLLKDEVKNSHEMQYQMAVEHGPIFMHKFVNFFSGVFIMDATASEQLVRKLGPQTFRFGIPHWDAYREQRGETTGVFSAQDEEWRHLRRNLDKPLLQMKYMAGYTEQLHPVMDDLVDHVAAARRQDGSVDKLDRHFFNWALESIAVLLYQRRFGCIDGTSDGLSKKFVHSVSIMFDLTMKIFPFPPKFVRYCLPFVWKRFTDCWDTFFIMARKCVLETKTSQKEGILSHILAQDQLTENEVVSSITETMMAAVDTTSNVVLWILYELARHRDVQDKLLTELNDVIPRGQHPSYDHIKQLHYLKAVVREGLRLHPPVTTINRKLPHDMVILGYQVPAETMIVLYGYGMSLSDEVFENPREFRPERWLRQNRISTVASFSSIPFGIGARMCIGRRIAELEMFLVLSQLIRRFDVTLTDSEPLRGTMRMLVVPEKQIPVSFKDR